MHTLPMLAKVVIFKLLRRENDMGTLVAFTVGLLLGGLVGAGFGCLITALCLARDRKDFDG